jgi:hypothetical protein
MGNINYENQALLFLHKTGVEMSVKFLRHGKHFSDDTDSRDIYRITLKRGNRKFVFPFGQSINASGKYVVREELQNKLWIKNVTDGKIYLTDEEFHKAQRNPDFRPNDIKLNPNFCVPTAYDVLSCLQKYDVGTFEDFCSEFGYDTDSRRAFNTYQNVLEEYKNICMLWNEKEIAKLQEIQ